MAADQQTDFRLAPDAQITWSIPKQEWDAYVRGRKRVMMLGVGATLALVLLIPIPLWVALYFVLSLPVSLGLSRLTDGYGVLILASAACMPLLLILALGRAHITEVRAMIAFRRRGDSVWALQGCVCPDCLRPFDAAGFATCKHRVAACQQPTILRILESDAVGTILIAEELRRALTADSRRRGIPQRGWSPLRRLRADEQDAWPKPVRVAISTCIKVASFLLVWIAAGWAAIAWIPSYYILRINSWLARRSDPIVRSSIAGRRIVCTKCQYVINDLARTSVCSECASDLTKIGAVRTSLVCNPTNSGFVGYVPIAMLAFAIVWGLYLAPRVVQLLPTSVLILGIDGSIGSARGFIDALGRRTLTQDENSAATAAILAWSERNPFGIMPSQASVIPTVETIAALDERSLGMVLSGVPSTAWLATTSRDWPEVKLRPDAVLTCGTDIVAKLAVGVPTRMTPVPLLIMIECGEITATNIADGRSVTLVNSNDTNQYELYGFQVCAVLPSAPIGQLAPGTYELASTYTVRILPPVPTVMISSPKTIEAAQKVSPTITRTDSVRVTVQATQ